MTSVGPTVEKGNFTYMFDKNYLGGCPEEEYISKNSMLGIIKSHPDFSKFLYIIQTAKMENAFNFPQADFTIFIPSDKAISYLGEDMFINMDYGLARQIINASILNKRITAILLEDSPVSYFITKDQKERLCITNVNGITCINNNCESEKDCIKIIHKNILANNGIIHVIDGIIMPTFKS